MAIDLSRRGFLGGLGSFAIVGAVNGADFPVHRKIRLAAVGVMGKGFGDWFVMVRSGLAELVAYCDADANKFRDAQGRLQKNKFDLDLSKIPHYTDYRRLLDDAKKLGIDAITVSTADHAHGAIAIRAMKMGIHCYVQKPLVRTLWEAKYFGDVAKEHGVVTQMGNQGSGGDGFRRNVEILQSGLLGDVKEVHVWTNRPVWPQGFAARDAVTNHAIVEPPKGLDWNAWLGVAAERPYREAYAKGAPKTKYSLNPYHPFNWRGYFDFGAGAFGDMACHTMNLPYRGLELARATSAECTLIEEKNDISFPVKSVVKLTYAARPSQVRKGVNLPEVTLFWYDGDEKPSAGLMPQICAMAKFKGKVPNTGCLIVGSKGVMCSCADYGQEAFVALNDEKVAVDASKHEACQAVAQSLPRRTDRADGPETSAGAASLAADGHYIEFLDAINGKGPVFRETHSRCYSDVEYSIPMMEAILIGTVAQRVPGRLRWDAKAQRFDVAAANAFVKPMIRKGWEF